MKKAVFCFHRFWWNMSSCNKGFSWGCTSFLLYSFLAAYKTILRAKQSQTLCGNLRNKRRLFPCDNAHIYLLGSMVMVCRITSSALSKTDLSGYWEITQTQKAYKFWSTVIGHQLFPFPPLPAPGKLWGTHFNYCVNIHLYMKQCTKCSLCSQSIRSLNSKHRINTNQLSKATIPLCFGFYRSHVDVLQS